MFGDFVPAPGSIVWEDPAAIGKGRHRGAMLEVRCRRLGTLEKALSIESVCFVPGDGANLAPSRRGPASSAGTELCKCRRLAPASAVSQAARSTQALGRADPWNPGNKCEFTGRELLPSDDEPQFLGKSG